MNFIVNLKYVIHFCLSNLIFLFVNYFLFGGFNLPCQWFFYSLLLLFLPSNWFCSLFLLLVVINCAVGVVLKLVSVAEINSRRITCSVTIFFLSVRGHVGSVIWHFLRDLGTKQGQWQLRRRTTM